MSPALQPTARKILTNGPRNSRPEPVERRTSARTRASRPLVAVSTFEPPQEIERAPDDRNGACANLCIGPQVSSTMRKQQLRPSRSQGACSICFGINSGSKAEKYQLATQTCGDARLGLTYHCLVFVVYGDLSPYKGSNLKYQHNNESFPTSPARGRTRTHSRRMWAAPALRLQFDNVWLTASELEASDLNLPTDVLPEAFVTPMPYACGKKQHAQRWVEIAPYQAFLHRSSLASKLSQLILCTYSDEVATILYIYI